MERHPWQREGRHWLLTSVLLLAACGARPRPPEGVNEADRTLIAAVRAAAAAALPPDAVEARVGRTAMVSTARPTWPDIPHKHDMDGEPGEAERFHVATAVHFVFWRRPVPLRGAHVVGIQWTAAGSPTVFFGVYDP